MVTFRKIFAILTTGLIWFISLLVFFVFSGAQTILADPELQSQKFLTVFFKEPLPRAAENALVLPVGLTVVGIFVGLAFNFLNDKLKYGWLKKGLIFGLLHWALMTPWFEFYLPYNAMREPLLLVLLETLLWLGVALTIGIYLSFIFNFKLESS